MKHTTMTLALVAAFAIAAAPPASSTRAQDGARPRVTAEHVAARVQSFYDQTTTVRTSFRQVHHDRLYQRTTRSRGVLTRPGSTATFTSAYWTRAATAGRGTCSSCARFASSPATAAPSCS